jgi:hypothetical protein
VELVRFYVNDFREESFHVNDEARMSKE